VSQVIFNKAASQDYYEGKIDMTGRKTVSFVDLDDDVLYQQLI
jgi:hypothetical protein